MATLDDAVVPEPAAPRGDAPWLVREVVRTLPSDQQRVLDAVADGHPLERIAEREGTTYAAARTRLSRARASLREALQR